MEARQNDDGSPVPASTWTQQPAGRQTDIREGREGANRSVQEQFSTYRQGDAEYPYVLGSEPGEEREASGGMQMVSKADLTTQGS